MDPLDGGGATATLWAEGVLGVQGSVAKITGKEGMKFSGPALVYDCEEDMLLALEQNRIVKGMPPLQTNCIQTIHLSNPRPALLRAPAHLPGPSDWLAGCAPLGSPQKEVR